MSRPADAPADRIAQIRERVEKATSAPWCYEAVGEKDNDWVVGVAYDENDRPISGEMTGSDVGDEEVMRRYGVGATSNSADARFIAHAREDIPWLLDQIVSLRSAQEALQAERDEARALFAAANVPAGYEYLSTIVYDKTTGAVRHEAPAKPRDLLAEIDALRAAKDAAEANWLAAEREAQRERQRAEQAERDADAAEATIARLGQEKAAFSVYVQHLHNCDIVTMPRLTLPCSCGLAALRSEEAPT